MSNGPHILPMSLISLINHPSHNLNHHPNKT